MDDKEKEKRLTELKADLKFDLKETWTGLSYSVKRMDILLISISGAGIYSCFEIIKYVHENNISASYPFKIIGLLFTTSIILNFMGQWSSKKAHYYQYHMFLNELHGIEEVFDNQKKIKELKQSSENFNDLSTFFDGFSIIIMIIGLIGMAVSTFIFL